MVSVAAGIARKETKVLHRAVCQKKARGPSGVRDSDDPPYIVDAVGFTGCAAERASPELLPPDHSVACPPELLTYDLHCLRQALNWHLCPAKFQDRKARGQESRKKRACWWKCLMCPQQRRSH